MKLQDPITNAQIYVKKHSSFKRRGESRNNGPSLAEIRERAFEIHIERGGIHGCDLGRLAAGGTRAPGKVHKSNDGGRKRNDQHIDTIVLAIANTPAIDTP